MDYDPDQMPSSFEEAVKHQNYCKCCARVSDRQPLPMCTSLNNLAHLGPGYPLYFDYIKFCIVLLLCQLLTSGAYSLFTNYFKGDDCVNDGEITNVYDQCNKDWITMFSIGNKRSKENLIDIQNYVDLGCLLIMIIFFQFFRKYIKTIDIKYDILDINPKDYTIWIQNIPKNFQAKNDSYEEDIREFIEQSIFRGDNEYQPGRTVATIDKEIQQIQDQIDTHLNKFYDGKGIEQLSKQFSGNAFISFYNSHAKQQCLEKYGDENLISNIFSGHKKIKYYNNTLRIRNAPDIKFYFYNSFERQQSKTFYAISSIKKIAFGQFLVSTILISVIDLLMPSTSILGLDSASQGDYTNYGNTFRSQGLSFKITVIIIGDTFIPFLAELTDIKNIFKRMKRTYYQLRQYNKQPILITQDKLNKIFEQPDFHIVFRYTIILKTMFLVSFYASLVPMGLAWGLLNMILTYWIDKYNLLRRRSVKDNLSVELAVEMAEMLEYSFIFYTVGNLLTNISILKTEDFDNLITYIGSLSFIIAVAHVILPMQKLNNWLFKFPENPPNEQNYEDAMKLFITDYTRENPSTKQLGRKLLFRKLELIKQDINKKQTYLDLHYQQQSRKSLTMIQSYRVSVLKPSRFDLDKKYEQKRKGNLKKNSNDDVYMENSQESSSGSEFDIYEQTKQQQLIQSRQNRIFNSKQDPLKQQQKMKPIELLQQQSTEYQQNTNNLKVNNNNIIQEQEQISDLESNASYKQRQNLKPNRQF
ncbi:hypothetical protein PPERSA_04282 [Pseudocohnilembus persalinus]|uniref:CSC1/OSCA1-like cytosolic domain-containing protein n=1 Tax=Pseudocohnilembus persalinus TaxID=266149 RepID=A0A0V0QND9_PSEPJ|nr:hypothetical protein PPERSA_04282 [Pseudocohnilembus persalinus]|eukprot:KRX03774.1 hypothetical protein PPERSA_04282 [Pseudocohnilembus persalinus]